MSIIKRRKKSIIPSGEDYKALDGSVSDLSKQTSELLSHFGESEQKSDTPKKDAVAKSANTKKVPGKSFDIIASPGVRRTLVRPVAPAKESQAEELLPEHAGKSYNELDYEDMHTKDKATPETITDKSSMIVEEENITKDAPAEALSAISIKPPGSLHFQQFETEDEKTANLVEEKEVLENKDEPQPSKDLLPKVETEIEPLATSEIKEESNTDAVEDDKSLKQEEEKVESNKDEMLPDENESFLSEKESDTDELYVNNLVKTTDKKGYVAPEGQQKPTVFDTNEYHPQLHDWSKLENKNGVKGYFLALLLVVAGALAYLILSGTDVPFIGNLF